MEENSIRIEVAKGSFEKLSDQGMVWKGKDLTATR